MSLLYGIDNAGPTGPDGVADFFTATPGGLQLGERGGGQGGRAGARDHADRAARRLEQGLRSRRRQRRRLSLHHSTSPRRRRAAINARCFRKISSYATSPNGEACDARSCSAAPTRRRPHRQPGHARRHVHVRDFDAQNVDARTEDRRRQPCRPAQFFQRRVRDQQMDQRQQRAPGAGFPRRQRPARCRLQRQQPRGTAAACTDPPTVFGGTVAIAATQIHCGPWAQFGSQMGSMQLSAVQFDVRATATGTLGGTTIVHQGVQSLAAPGIPGCLNHALHHRKSNQPEICRLFAAIQPSEARREQTQLLQ